MSNLHESHLPAVNAPASDTNSDAAAQNTRRVYKGATLYDIAAQLLLEHDVQRVEDAYPFFPDLHPRTVRRVWKTYQDTVLKDKGIKSLKEKKSFTSFKDSISPEDLNTVTEKAQQAGVRTWNAVTAMTRFGHSLERVMKVLDDICTLAQTPWPARTPSALFVDTMRHGRNIKVPEATEARKEAKKPKHEPLKVGEWVRWNLEWMRVMLIQGTQALLSPSAELHDSYKCPTDNLLHLPRAQAAPVG